MRLNKYIAENSQYSRRKADELIKRGKIFINGKKAELGSQVGEDDKVSGIPLKTFEKTYLAFNKPAGYISTRKDELGRKTIMDLLPKIPNLKPVGRLDKDTEGLMFISNDGYFINHLTHPKYECEKEYYVEYEGFFTEQDKRKLERGIVIEGRITAPAKISNQKESSLNIIIHEGRKRQIRNMFATLSHPVKYLKRVRIGSIKLGSLKKGEHRKLTKSEINAHKPT